MLIKRLHMIDMVTLLSKVGADKVLAVGEIFLVPFLMFLTIFLVISWVAAEAVGNNSHEGQTYAIIYQFRWKKLSLDCKRKLTSLLQLHAARVTELALPVDLRLPHVQRALD
tara:strand:- start:242 stop:577 length:336 start_codon:yes stop_codon:yes gene_type:complete